MRKPSLSQITPPAVCRRPDAAMVRKRVLVPLLVAATLLVPAMVVMFALEVPCPDEPAEEEGGPGSSPTPSPAGSGSGEEADCFCPRAAVYAVCFVVGVIGGIAYNLCYDWLVDGEEEEEEEAAAKKAGYVAIAGDLEVAGTGTGGKN